MAAFGVDHAVVGLAADDDADADAGAYRYIDTIFDRFGAAPYRLTQSGGVDVGVKAHGHPQSLPEAAQHGEISPLQLGRRGDVPISWGVSIQIHWPKAPHAHGRHLLLPEKGQDLWHGVLRISGGEADSLQNLALCIANSAYHLRATGFQGAKMQHICQLLFIYW